MSALSPPPTTPAAIDPSALRLVLFGMPDAGKSSLLGALSQAAEHQGRALHGHLSDLSQGLAELRQRVYDDRARETQEEIVPYPVRFSPYGHPSRAAVLYDCDGRAANDLLTQKRSLEQENRQGTLAGAVLSADALILTVDASAPYSQVEDDFREFLRFLRFLESHRGKEHAVGGLPVYLVLTKCDLLAGDGTISRSVWDARIEERKRDVMERFKHFLAGAGVRGGEFRFGSIDLEVRATAVRRPSLTDAPPQPREPFGVAELFHQAFAESISFRERQARSHKRLLVTVAGAGGFLAALAVAGVVLFVHPERTTEFTLADRVEALRASEGPDAKTRLGPNLDRRLKEWLEIQSHPQFAELPGELQTLVKSRLDEGEAYVTFRDAVAALPPPGVADSLAELAKIQVRWKETAPPASFAEAWVQTDAVQKRMRTLEELSQVRHSADELIQGFIALSNRATSLMQSAEMNAEWNQAALRLDAEYQALPSDKFTRVATPTRYQEVSLAYDDWRKSRIRLALIRDLAEALGMVGESDEHKSPLAFPSPSEHADIPALYAVRMSDLTANYSRRGLARSLEVLPDTLRPEIEKRIRRSIEQAIRDGQRVVLDAIESVTGGNGQMPADWARVGELLLRPSHKEWRELNAFLAQLPDPKAEDPAAATANFLRQPTFELEPKRIQVRIPDTLSDAPVRPAGELTLFHRKRGSDEMARVTFRLTGEPERDKQSVIYTFAATDKSKMTYRPTDTFFAELPVRKGSKDLKLTWASSRTLAFQFERLLREPRLHEPEQSNVDGLLAVGVTAKVIEGNFPIVPAMIPIVSPPKK